MRERYEAIRQGQGFLSSIHLGLIERQVQLNLELRFLAGRAWKFADDIDTDAVIPGRYLVINEPGELAGHLFEGVRPEMAGEVKDGDIVVAG